MPGIDSGAKKATGSGQSTGVGPIVATALVSEVGHWKEYWSPTRKTLAAWVGLVPKQCSSSSKERIGSDLEAGEPGSCDGCSSRAPSPFYPDIRGSMARGASGLRMVWSAGQIKVAAVALADEIARMAWAMMVRGEQVGKSTRSLPAANRRQEFQRIGEGMTT